MTRKEKAISIIKNELACVKNVNCERAECRTCNLVMPEHDVIEALDMAIKALEQEPVLDKIKGYIDHIRNTGMGKKKSLEFIEKFIEGLKAESEENYSIKTVTNAEEAEEYQISEDISKGFEEFTKMIFKQGQKESEVQEEVKKVEDKNETDY